ncbi:MAG: triose-phosphate isomerase [Gammaproteobacteria bacterium]
MRQSLVVGNWKMHGNRTEVVRLAKQIIKLVASSPTEVALAPPFPFLTDVERVLTGSGIELAAQNVAVEPEGAFTGEVAAEMVADVGCRYVIVGHSERRTLYGESAETVADKAVAVLRAGLLPIVCVGETLDQRRDNSTREVVERQLDVVFEKVPAGSMAQLVIAYEPVWAIGTGLTAEPAQVAEVHGFIRQSLGTEGDGSRILYGGSVKPDNAQALFALDQVDGGLIGGASLDENSFAAICRAAE